MDSLARFLTAIEHLSAINAEMPIHYAAALIHIHKAPGITQADLAAKIGMSTATASRLTSKLLEEKWGLIAQVRKKHNKRAVEIRLTPEGELLIEKLIVALHPA